MKRTDRREFLKQTAISAGALAAIPGIIAASTQAADAQVETEILSEVFLKKNDVILFQGDSITDAGRDKKDQRPNDPWAFGPGYVFLAASHLLDQFAEKNLTIYNRGISGNKVFQLADRWEPDCLELNPKLLSILIGVNDYWHMHDGKYDGTIEVYENDYRALLKRTKAALPDVKLVIGEPFAVLGCRAVDNTWFPAFDAYRKVARKLANEFDAIFIPYQSVFDEASKRVEPTYWTADGVHPTVAGCHLMAAAWLKSVFGME